MDLQTNSIFVLVLSLIPSSLFQVISILNILLLDRRNAKKHYSHNLVWIIYIIGLIIINIIPFYCLSPQFYIDHEFISPE